jgi:hypothetical protein
MTLFPDDLQKIEELAHQQAEAIKHLLAQQTRFDPELTKACQEHTEHGQYADAVFKAFRVLEGRIQQRSGVHGESAVKTLHLALKPDGPLTTKLGLSRSQAASYRDLLIGAFAFFRNPEAHPSQGLVEYGSGECQIVLGLVNMMLKVLDRKPDQPLDAALRQIQGNIGPDATIRLHHFLNQVAHLNLKVEKRSASFSYRAYAWRPTKQETPPKRAPTTVFNLRFKAMMPTLSFHAHKAWDSIVGFSRESHIERLKALGGVDAPKYGTVYFDLRQHNQAATFEQLYAVVRDIVDDMEATLNGQEKT